MNTDILYQDSCVNTVRMRMVKRKIPLEVLQTGLVVNDIEMISTQKVDPGNATFFTVHLFQQ